MTVPYFPPGDCPLFSPYFPPAIKYVFGEANEAKSEVPYAAEEYFKEHGSYNLTMRMGSFGSQKGHRYYIVSGN